VPENDYPLTEEQKTIVTSPPDQPQMVVAPPGAGKTHTVIARIQYLVEQAGLDPASELLVLCFSRVAVREIVKRLKDMVRDRQVHDDLRFVSVRTFDSFATRILLAAGTERDLKGFGYDARIELAIEALENPESDASLIVSRCRHLIVDEIQDLVGVRGRLVQVLLKRISGGFTLLGDPAQAIYGFSAKNKGKTFTTDTLLEWVRRQEWVSGLIERTLTTNYRSTGETARMAWKIRKDVLSGSDTSPEALKKLQGFVNTLREVGSGIKPGDELSRPLDKTVCVLCRSNGEVLQLASLLSLKEVNFYLKPRPEDSGLPPWLGRVLGTYPSRYISSSEFINRWKDLVRSDEQPEPQIAWEWLKRVEGQERPDLDVRELHKQFYRGQSLPDDADAFLSGDQNGISISTVHAVKGREFDQVVILQPEQSGGIDQADNSLEEARVLYVAATRARRELARLGRSGLPKMWVVDCPGGRRRWVARQQASRCYFMEVGLSGDVDACSPVSTFVHPDLNTARTAQDLLWSGIGQDTRLHIYRITTGNYTFYRIACKQVASEKTADVAQLSLPIIKDMALIQSKVSNGKPVWLPEYWDNLRVAATVTEILPPYPEHVFEPYATSGFCLGLRIRGMDFIYKER
jgi:DNA helicase-2/ATP-dependent DNA helicase PcrA